MPHDFFLSYATLDDRQAIPGDDQSKWVSVFRRVLTQQLQTHLGRDPDVFFDNADLAGNSALTPEINAAVDDSHLFVAIGSPTYYQRRWCKDERQRFIARLGANPVLAQRVFVIHPTLMDLELWQKEFFPDLRGYNFFRQDDSDNILTLGAPALHLKVVAAPDEYFIAINRLARDMARKIKELEKPAPPPPPPVVPDAVPVQVVPADGPDIVYLAENAFRSQADREGLRLALLEEKFEVRPVATLTGKTAPELTAAMNGSLAFVQIVGQSLLEIAGGEGKTFDQVQLEAARTAGLPLFRWRSPDLNIEVGSGNFPGFKEFALAADVREQLLPTFKADLITALKDLSAARRIKKAVQGDERLVLVTGASTDLAVHGDAVGQMLEQHALGKYLTETPAEEAQAEDVRGMLVIYGGSSAEEVRDRLKVVRSLPKTRQQNLRVGIFFCAPPPDVATRRLLYDMPSFLKVYWNNTNSFTAFAQAVMQ